MGALPINRALPLTTKTASFPTPKLGRASSGKLKSLPTKGQVVVASRTSEKGR